MRLRHIELFHAVLTTGSLTGAADLLNISQPASSKARTTGARCVATHARSTSSVSAAPQMPVRRILALTAIAIAISGFADRST